MRRRVGGRVATAVAVALAVAVPLSGAQVLAAPAALADPDDGYPSWDEVKKAEHNAEAAEAAAEKLQSALNDLQEKDAIASKNAQIAEENWLQAQQDLDDATAVAQQLESSAAAAQQQADDSSRRAASIIAQLGRMGGGDITMQLLLGSQQGADDLLARLGSMGRLSETSQELIQRAIYDHNAAQSLADQAAIAEQARAEKAQQAQDAYTTAQNEEAAIAAQVKTEQKSVGQINSEIAYLVKKSAAVRKQYEAGQAAQDPPSSGGGSGGSGGSGSGGSGSGGSGSGGSDPSPSPSPTKSSSPSPSPSPSSGGGSNSGGGSTTPPGDPQPNTAKVNTAIAFAKAHVGDAYQFAGAGPHVWDCSGLTLKAYQAAGVYIGTHGATDQYNYLRSVGRLVPVGHREAGDLLFYSDGGTTTGEKYHVAIYIGGGQMIEAAHEGVPVRTTAVRSYDLVGFAGRPTA